MCMLCVKKEPLMDSEQEADAKRSAITSQYDRDTGDHMGDVETRWKVLQSSSTANKG